MPVLYKRGLLESTRVTMISPDYISPNPDQPRRYFDPDGMAELADSIRVHGILQPLTVRRKGGGRYELIAGERRLRAAMICGLTEVPCLVMDVDRENSCLLSLIENLQRRDLDFWEEAKALERLIQVYGLSQEEAAAKVGKSQSAVANKLRLLRLPPDVLEALRQNGLTERHGRALLRLPDGDRQRAALLYIIDNGLTVAATDAYIDALLQEPEPEAPKPGSRRTFVLKDVRVFLNTLSRSIDLMKQGGIDAGVQREETEDRLILTISIPKNKAAEAE